MKKALVAIPYILSKVKISNSRRPLYYFPSASSKRIRSKRGKEAPKRYFIKGINDYRQLDERYCIMFISDGKRKKINNVDLRIRTLDQIKVRLSESFTKRQLKIGKFYLCNAETEARELANPRAAGTAKYETINYQKLYNGSYHPVTRAKIVNALKKFYLPYLEGNDNLRSFLAPDSTYDIEVFIICNIKDGNWDIGNRANIYGKTFLDFITNGKIGEKRVIEPFLSDDNVNFIRAEKHSYIQSDVEEGIMFSITKHDFDREMRVFKVWKRLINK